MGRTKEKTRQDAVNEILSSYNLLVDRLLRKIGKLEGERSKYKNLHEKSSLIVSRQSVKIDMLEEVLKEIEQEELD